MVPGGPPRKNQAVGAGLWRIWSATWPGSRRVSRPPGAASPFRCWTLPASFPSMWGFPHRTIG